MKKPSIQTLIDQNWQLCRKLVLSRAGKQCELCHNRQNLQVDHCFSRNNKALFYDLDNLTALCQGCHLKKSVHFAGTDLKVFELVKQRVGENRFNLMRSLVSRRTSFPNWQYRWYHEQKQIQLKELLAETTETGDINHE